MRNEGEFAFFPPGDYLRSPWPAPLCIATLVRTRVNGRFLEAVEKVAW
jgi:hypothetical protein